MNTTVSTTDPSFLQPSSIRPRQAGFARDVIAIAGRALRALPRDTEAVIPPVFIAMFFFLVNIGTLQKLTETNIPGLDYKAFMMATAILLGVSGVSRAGALVLDVQNGYFDRLLLRPVRRLAILIAMQTSFLLFFPFLFLTTSYVPRAQLTGWLDTVATWNPVTYLLDGLRVLLTEGWEWTDLGQALVAVAVVGAVSMTLCFGALRGRLRQA